MKKYFYIILLLFLSSCKTREFAIVKINDKFGTNKKGEIFIEPILDYILQKIMKKYLTKINLLILNLNLLIK